MKKRIAGVSVFLLAVSCSNSFETSTANTSKQNVDGGDGPCQKGEQRCLYRMLQTCKDGVFTEEKTCEKACSDVLGCVDCDPKAGNTCSNSNVHRCKADGTVGEELQKCITEPCTYGKCGASLCSPESQLIYVVDYQNRLLSFSPANGANTFKKIKKLDCPAGPDLRSGLASTPFSMSVDRSGKAWILYSSGEIFWVDTKTGNCSKTNFVPKQLGFELFGMGFVTDAPGSSKEKLYISGGSANNLQPTALGYIDPQTLKVTKLGSVETAEYSPELTGTGKAALYAYFPGVKDTFVAEIDKKSGSSVQKWKLEALSGNTRAWAFAHWGGKFYIFVTTQASDFDREIPNVLRLDPSTGKTETILKNTDYPVVGAGVSTCAPTLE